MRALILCALLIAITMAQRNHPLFENPESDRHAGYRFEYHSQSEILLVRDRDGTCYVFEVTSDIEDQYTDKSTQDSLEDDLIEQIDDASNLDKESGAEALRKYHDILLAAECRHEDIYELDYNV